MDPRKLAAEFLGTFWLVLGGTGAAVFAATLVSDFGDGQQISVGLGYLGVSLAFGLTVVTGAYALGAVSGGHFNPAITIAAWVAGRFEGKDVAPYVVTQVVGGIAASGVVAIIGLGLDGFVVRGGGRLAANGYGDHSPQGYDLASGFIAEIVMTFFFLIVILGVTSKRWGNALTAPLAIGLTLTLIHLISIPITNTSVNPARSTGPAVIAGGWAMGQLWLFWLAPIIGGVLAALFTKYVMDAKEMGPGAVEPEDLPPATPESPATPPPATS